MLSHNKKNNLEKKITGGSEITNLSSETPTNSNKVTNLKEILENLIKLLKNKNATQVTLDKTINIKIPDGQEFFKSSTNKLSSGRHALNNLLGSEIFVIENAKEGQVNLLELCNSLTILAKKICTYLKFDNNYIEALDLFECKTISKENYNSILLNCALLYIGKKALPHEKDKIEEHFLYRDNIKMVYNLGNRHWISFSWNKNGNIYYYDSLQPQKIVYKDDNKFLERINNSNNLQTSIFIDQDSSLNNSANLVENYLVDYIYILLKKRNPGIIINNRTELIKELTITNPVLKPYKIVSKTDFMIKHDGDIYAMGDIHGDIIPLIICLRDCCRVIKKKENFYFNQDKIDDDLNKEMNKSWDDKTFADDLNYEWCGGNAYVVFCGDILDNVRHGDIKKPGEFPFEEARIFKFINAINEQAMKQHGRLFKVLGNHDMKNLNGDPSKDCISQFAINYKGYRSNNTLGRLDYFGKGKPGAELIGKDGAFLFLMINNIIFVHGGINTKLLDINNIKKVNESLMKYIYNEGTSIDFSTYGKSIEAQITFGDNDGLTLDRSFGYKKNKTDKEMCDRLHSQFYKFVNSIKSDDKYKNIFPYNPDKMKLVIGHCTQIKKQKNYMYTTMFTQKISREGKDNVNFNEEFGGQVSQEDPSRKIYGITVSCGNRNSNGNMDLNDPTIIRLDNAMSRGFNSDYFPYFDDSRTSQVLKIKNGKVTVVKSSEKNRNAHLTEQTTTYRGKTQYKQKYEKYKSKYIKLKDEINNI
jgi:hypothetical protein